MDLDLLNRKAYGLTRVFDVFLLSRTGMLDEFEEVFHAIGWSNFWEINEPGCELLTREFVMTLRSPLGVHGTRISFRLFGCEFSLSYQEPSEMLGFAMVCNPNTEFTAPQATTFWREISRQVRGKSSISRIRNPTLRFLARWVTLVLLPHDDVCCVNAHDLEILHAMYTRRKISPVRHMVRCWLDLTHDWNAVTITSLVTRIANRLELLEDSNIEYIQNDPDALIGASHFIHAHFLRENPFGDFISFILKKKESQ